MEEARRREPRGGRVHPPGGDGARKSKIRSWKPWRVVGGYNKDFLLALAADFKRHGPQAIEKVRKMQPASYLKICASLLVPKEFKVEPTAGIKGLTDDELEQMLAMLKAMMAAGEAAKGCGSRAELASA